jgi:hypothetical protein
MVMRHVKMIEKRSSKFRVRRVVSLIVILGLAAGLLGVLAPATTAIGQRRGFDPDTVRRATVLIMQVYANPVGETVMSCVGSGTLVSRDGLILTNAHIALPLAGCRADRLAIALTLRLDEPPVPKYYAQVVVSNIGWDLAVLQITDTIDDLPVDRETLALPFVELGASEDVRLDSTIEVVGYAPPEQQEDTGDSISRVIPATVSGFTAEARVGDRAWIKTRAALPGTMSGGGAYNADGLLVGVPTVEPATSGLGGGAFPDCRRIQDSTGDGRVDEQDLCIPISGLINALRPSRLARGLILAARLGITPQSQQPVRFDQPPPAPPRFSRLIFASGVDLAGMPTTVITRAPTGITQLYLFFDYENMADGMIYELRVLRDGLLDPTFSLAPATWSGGERGLWYTGSTAQAWPNGEYEFILFIEGVRAATARITIGGPALPDPEFSTILFGVVNPEGELVSTGNLLPVSNTINAQFVYNNMQPGIPWRQVWYYDGVPISDGVGAWAGGANGTQAVNASSPPDQPLQPGRYRLELYVGDRMTATADFLMAGGQVALSTEVFTNLLFTTAISAAGSPAGPVSTSFPNTIAGLYAVFDWRDVAPGTPFTWRWTVDDNPLFEVTQSWVGAATGSGAWLQLETRSRLPDGSYKLELLIAGVVKASATARVGLGQLPIAIFTREQGVRLQGDIVDAESGQGIFGVSVIVLRPEFDVRDFTWQMTEVFDMALTDSGGRFVLSRPLVRGETYSMLVLARSYLPASTDGLRIAQDTPDPTELRIELNRD